jgi:hypothetical protein
MGPLEPGAIRQGWAGSLATVQPQDVRTLLTNTSEEDTLVSQKVNGALASPDLGEYSFTSASHLIASGFIGVSAGAGVVAGKTVIGWETAAAGGVTTGAGTGVVTTVRGGTTAGAGRGMVFGLRGTVEGNGGNGGGVFCAITGTDAMSVQTACNASFRRVDAFIRIGAESNSTPLA